MRRNLINSIIFNFHPFLFQMKNEEMAKSEYIHKHIRYILSFLFLYGICLLGEKFRYE